LRAVCFTALLVLVPSVLAAQTLNVSFDQQQQTSLPVSRWAAAAFFSAERVFGESAAGKRALGELTALREKRSTEANERAQALKAERDKLEAGTSLLSEQARDQAQKKIERFEIDMQRFLQDAQSELEARQRELEAAFQKQLTAAVERVAKARGVQLVFNRSESGLHWGDPALDISDELVAQLNRASSAP
jgi:Skp family chaperone for outer membrane proteins